MLYNTLLVAERDANISAIYQQVYGETSYEFIDQIIRTIDFTEDDRFIDLGSGW